jgi:beta-lactamase superfamily II metal-dependent hydrolase
MEKQRLYFLDVGQGMCTYFEEYDAGDIVANVLFDLGSTKSRRRAGVPTLEFLVERIKARDWTGDEGQLDAVFISHKDADHVNLLWSLLDLLPKMLIWRVYHSGRYEWYTSSKGNILNELGKRTEDADRCVRNFRIGASSFYKEPWTPIWCSDYNARAYVIAVNTSDSTGNQGKEVNTVYSSSLPDGDLANSTSLGIYLRMYDVGAVMFGDATFSTFQFVNRVFLAKGVWLENSFALHAPHHGSRLTTFGLNATDGAISEEAAMVVDTFASLAYGATIIVSADTSHCHPSLETINAFVKHSDFSRIWWEDPTIAPYHYASVYFDLPLSDELAAPKANYTYQTGLNFYTSLYYGLNTTQWNFSYPPMGDAIVPTGPATEGMNWMYEIVANSSIFPSNIPLVGIPSNRLPQTVAALDALFVEAHAVRERQQQAGTPTPPPQPAPAAGTARASATPQARLRRLKPRP